MHERASSLVEDRSDGRHSVGGLRDMSVLRGVPGVFLAAARRPFIGGGRRRCLGTVNLTFSRKPS